jgi:hypothetical protein
MPAQFWGFDEDNIYTNPDGVIVGTKAINKRLKIFFQNSDCDPYDPDDIKVLVEDEKDNEILNDDLASGLISKEDDGIYYIDAINTTYVPNYDLVANAPKRFSLKWQYQDVAAGEWFLALSYLHVLTNRTFGWFPRLRNEIDKAFKLIGDARIGYTEGNLMFYLQGGLDEINKFPPVTSFTFANYPDRYGQLLIDSAAVVAITSQALFAVDTDVGTFSDQGFSFTLDHFSKLNTMMTALLNKIKEELRMLKMEFSGLGSVTVQMTPHYPFYVFLRTAPSGSLFRNFFVSS